MRQGELGPTRARQDEVNFMVLSFVLQGLLLGEMEIVTLMTTGAPTRTLKGLQTRESIVGNQNTVRVQATGFSYRSIQR